MAFTSPLAPHPATSDAVRARLEGRRFDPAGSAFKGLLVTALVLTIVVLGVLLVDVITGGASVLTSRLGDFLTGTLGSQPESSGLAQAIRGTVWIGIFVVAFSFPVGIGAAVYLEEYAAKSRFARFVDINIRNLAGVPSVVYGILGLAVFVGTLKGLTGGRTVIAAGITLAILVLPIVIITASEAIRAVPNGIREAGYGVGATRWEVVRSHVLPYAAPGILTGTVLALARALGEAAPLILVGAVTGFLGGGTSYGLGTLDDRFTALPIVIATWAGRPGEGWESVTSAAIVILLIVVLLANAGAIVLRNRYEKKR
jgi:phosphate transport system permease protein